MKKVFAAFLSALPFLAAAQLQQGHIVYEVSTNMRFGPPGAPAQGFTQTFELFFTEKESIYSHLPEAVNSYQSPDGTLFQPQNSSITYFNFAAARKVTQHELQDAVYLLREPIEKEDWTITSEEKTLLNHKVVKAYTYRQDSSLRTIMENGVLRKETLVDTTRIEAWFAPGIPVPAGPAQFQGQLPGLVLEVRYENDRRVYLAKEIGTKVKTALLKEPLKGKPVSRAEFQKALERQVTATQQYMPGQQIRKEHDN